MTKSPKNQVDQVVYELTHHDDTLEKPNLDGDRLNFWLLIALYVIQGFPIGLSGAIPNLLQSKYSTDYNDQAIFSLAMWPYTVKLLWAPIVDALYVRCIGRRKSWLLPLQILMGSLLLIMAYNIYDWLPESAETKPNLRMLVFVVFSLNFLSATQDIVVDGWSLTMLKSKNVNYSSTCNAVGVPIGMFIGSTCFTLATSEQFRNQLFPNSLDAGGLMTMKSFLYIWAVIVFFTTIFVGKFKKEKDIGEDGSKNLSVFKNYVLLYNILKLPRIKVLAIALLTIRIGFIATECVSHLKILEAGLSNDAFMIMQSLMYLAKFGTSVFASKYITGSKPMSYYLKVTPIRLGACVVYTILVYYTPSLIQNNGVTNVPIYYYIVLGLVILVNEMLNFFMLLAVFAFFSQISDPRFGGTYMTLFNTIFFVGWIIPNTIVYKMVSILTFNRCSKYPENCNSTVDSIDTCRTICVPYVDGYYTTTAICIGIGVVWYFAFKDILKHYQSLNLSNWIVYSKKKINNAGEIKDVHIPALG
ncbi:Major facilitator superfamily domain,Acetyl-coenzyme A transporter 1 [Cinara cedri]|uniref:Major facilitator superfamily domain,Acetyl-coenzyme A transporter 1 n=1 Tax=Cinara cedri TaxID=506608 RepID=A0A5E4MBK2_9HEMI|nr:Major facilitator superfamily domain,Acetyl-coenzyme A transporter 1 [Cinara cedri]